MEENKNTYSKVVHEYGNYFYTGLYKRLLEMAEIKGLILLFNAFGWTIAVYAAFISLFNVDVFTRSVFGFLGTVFLLAKIISFSLSTWRRHKIGLLEIRKLRNDEKDRELKTRKEELDTYERENAIIKNFNK